MSIFKCIYKTSFRDGRKSQCKRLNICYCEFCGNLYTNVTITYVSVFTYVISIICKSCGKSDWFNISTIELQEIMEDQRKRIVFTEVKSIW